MSGSDWFGLWSGLGQVRVRSLSGWVRIGIGVEIGPSYSQVVARSELWLGQGWVRVRSM